MTTPKNWQLLHIFAALICLAPPIFAQNKSPSNQTTLETSQTGSSKLRNADQFVANQSASTLSASFVQRHKLFNSAWHGGVGLRSDNYFFNTDPSFPVKSLHADSARLLLEYHRDGEAVAYIMLSPGFYFENKISAEAFDVPVEMASGIPITQNFNGVLGVSLGRFFHHPVPIAGFVWDISTRVELRALYPEPALTVKVNEKWKAGVGGQLIGAGFTTDSGAELTRINYFSYRAGALVSYQRNERFSLSLRGGVEMRREFDAYRQTRRLNTSGAPYAQLECQF